MDKEILDEGLLGGFFGKDKATTDEEKVRKDLETLAADSLDMPDADLSKVDDDKLMKVVQAVGLDKENESLENILNNIKEKFDDLDEELLKKALLDRYGFLDDEVSTIYENIKKEHQLDKELGFYECGTVNLSTEDFTEALNKAKENNLTGSDKCFKYCEELKFVPTKDMKDYIKF